jgi:hypothetical protein
MGKRLVSYNPVTGLQTNHVYDQSTGKTHIENVQDCSKIVDYCQKLANNSEYKRQGIKSDYYHFATVPNIILLELKQKYNLDWTKKHDLLAIERVLARDYRKLLTVNRI